MGPLESRWYPAYLPGRFDRKILSTRPTFREDLPVNFLNSSRPIFYRVAYNYNELGINELDPPAQPWIQKVAQPIAQQVEP